ncbi:MAG: hypothetical protein DRG76_09720 [Deltaproteobacteria bacterium]|nr:MAG: hypothetical protein DRG76_09720 [Deltaproteobacteria bacterium]
MNLLDIQCPAATGILGKEIEMGRIIDMASRGKAAPDNLIVKQPLEFRRADWGLGFFIQMTRRQSEWLEAQRNALYSEGKEGIRQLPPHYSLQGGVANTIRALYTYRHKEEQMRRVYFLAGLVDCLINQVNPILRTAMLRDLYNKVQDLRAELSVTWHGTLDQVLLPIDSAFFNELEYRHSLATAQTLKALYTAIEEGTRQMFDILSLEYVFYCPYRRR